MRTLVDNGPRVLVMVGLPARGKTYLARKLVRYLNWRGVTAQVFNVGNYRRRDLGSAQPAAFFDPDNPVGFEARRGVAQAALDDLMQWVAHNPNGVAVYDATNVTRSRRAHLTRTLAEVDIEPIFVESICTDEAVVEANIRETKLSMPDYADARPDAATRDFRARIAHYQRSYEPLTTSEGPWIKLVDVGEQVHLNRIRGFLPSRIVFFLMNLHIVPRPIFLMRHGESAYNVQKRIGGDPDLTERGRDFADRASQYLQRRCSTPPSLWTSTLQRTIQTASAFPWTPTALRSLDEIDAGRCDGWTYDEVRTQMPEEFAARKLDKLRYRYPRGESYEDVMDRLEPLIVELERQRDPVVIVAHQAVLRCLVAYLTDRSPEDCPFLEIPLHTVIELVPKAYPGAEVRTELGP
ncbi:MAG: 6-phosphofructo-2-kinase/fructose-2,6-bisphosphatase [Myxococcales bacterium]|nr:6-phosphofructo-2-kinase/fructose-2,6-bisphosphatase [Myxococcales bacterium]